MIVCPGTALRVKNKADKVNFKHVIGIYISGAAPRDLHCTWGHGRVEWGRRFALFESFAVLGGKSTAKDAKGAKIQKIWLSHFRDGAKAGVGGVSRGGRISLEIGL